MITCCTYMQKGGLTWALMNQDLTLTDIHDRVVTAEQELNSLNRRHEYFLMLAWMPPL